MLTELEGSDPRFSYGHRVLAIQVYLNEPWRSSEILGESDSASATSVIEVRYAGASAVVCQGDDLLSSVQPDAAPESPQ